MKRMLISMLLCVILCGCGAGDRAMQRRKIGRTSPQYQKTIEQMYDVWREQERLKKRQQKLDEFMDWYEKKYGGKK